MANPNRRSRARQYALQALYQWQVAGHDVHTVEQQFLEDEGLAKADVALFVDLLRGVPTQVRRLDQALAPLLSRPLEQLDPVERAVLYIGAYELGEHRDIPYRVVINEAVELAKSYGAEQSHRFVNGVLDKLARRLRPNEDRPAARRPRAG
jgi:N utilization substance protein B